MLITADEIRGFKSRSMPTRDGLNSDLINGNNAWRYIDKETIKRIAKILLPFRPVFVDLKENILKNKTNHKNHEI
jgi:hypothetical protein